MSDETDLPPEEVALASSMHEAIFSFSMTIFRQYRQTMDVDEAADKVAAWLEELARKLREEAFAVKKERQKLTESGTDV